MQIYLRNLVLLASIILLQLIPDTAFTCPVVIQPDISITEQALRREPLAKPTRYLRYLQSNRFCKRTYALPSLGLLDIDDVVTRKERDFNEPLSISFRSTALLQVAEEVLFTDECKFNARVFNLGDTEKTFYP